MAGENRMMNYLFYFSMMVAVGGVLMLMSKGFVDKISRCVESVFDRVEYRLALRAQERESFRIETASMNVTQFRTSETQRVVKNSTKPRGIARVAA
jgi:hypothetical protein